MQQRWKEVWIWIKWSIMMATSLILPQSFQGLKLGDQVSMDIEREPVWGMSMNTLELNTSFYVCPFFFSRRRVHLSFDPQKGSCGLKGTQFCLELPGEWCPLLCSYRKTHQNTSGPVGCCGNCPLPAVTWSGAMGWLVPNLFHVCP